jgi:hypothetical protein
MKKILTALTVSIPVLALGVSLAAPASAAYDAGRDAACKAIGGVYNVGNNASNDRCIVTTSTTAAPVASGTPSTTTIQADVDESYLSLLPVRVEKGTPTFSTATVYGDWSVTHIVGAPSCVYAGKSKVQKCTSTTSAIETRDIFTITTVTTPLFDVYEVLQDRQSVTTGTQPTTVTTTTRTVRYHFANNSSALANVQSDVSTDTSVAGDPITINEVGDTYTVKVGEQQVATAPDIDVLEPVLSGVEKTEPIVINTVKCVINGSTQTVRDNSCPVPGEYTVA